MLLFAIALVGLISTTRALATPTPTPTPPTSTPAPPTPTSISSPPPTSFANTSRFVYFHGESMCSFDPNLGCAVGVKNVSGLVVLDKQTEQLYKVQPFRNGLPLCNDPAYVVGALGSSCYDTSDILTPSPNPISPLP